MTENVEEAVMMPPHCTLVQTVDDDDPLWCVNLLGALNYLAFGRFEGQHGVRPWYTFPRTDPEHDAKERAARGVAARQLQRLIRKGEVTVYQSVLDNIDGPGLWKVEAREWESGAAIWGHGNVDYVQGGSETAWTVQGPLFSAEEIAAHADPEPDEDTWGAEAPVDDEAPPPRKPGKRRGPPLKHPHAKAIGGFLAHMMQLGMETVQTYTQETWGAYLSEEYEALGTTPPHEDTCTQLAVGAIEAWQRRISGDAQK